MTETAMETTDERTQSTSAPPKTAGESGAARVEASQGTPSNGAAAGEGTSEVTKESLTLKLGPEGIASLILDCPGQKLNVLSRALFEELDRHLDTLERGSPRGLIIASGKPGTFVAGADIEEFVKFQTAEEATGASRAAQRLLDRLENAPYPVVAAIDGICLGGGMELALACMGRVASDNPKTMMGQPEVKLGLIPGAGGCQRLPALVGLMESLPLILTGRNLSAMQALKIGLVDEVVPVQHLMTSARRLIKRLAKRDIPRRGRRGFGPWLTRLLMEKNVFGRNFVFRKALQEAEARSHGHYPAIPAALDAVRARYDLGGIDGYVKEAELFGRLAVGSVSRHLVDLFFATTDLKKDTGVEDAGVKPAPVRKVGVLGAGFMGAGIAEVLAYKKFEARLRDLDPHMLGKALAGCRKAFDKRATRRRMTRSEADQAMDRLSGTLDYTGFDTADMIIEAVFEDLDLKHRVLKEAEEHMREEAIFATNTSSLPIGNIAEASRRPENVVGMHFFSPVPKMPLLEVIRGPKTSDQTIVTTVECGKRMGKTVIVVNDGPGFYTSRVLGFMMNEAALMLEEGADALEVDRAMVAFGFPVGPFTLLDEVGMDVGYHVTHILNGAFGERMPIPSFVNKLKEDGRLGRKNEKGMYLYKKGKKIKKIDPTVYDLVGSRTRRRLSAEVIQNRLVLTFVNETARCLEEGLLRTPRDGDIGAIFGLGFPPFRGGPLRYADTIGCSRVVKTLEEMAETVGPRLAPTQLLVEKARSGGGFYE